MFPKGIDLFPDVRFGKPKFYIFARNIIITIQSLYLMNRSIFTTAFIFVSMILSFTAHASDHEKDLFTTSSGKSLEITFIKHGTLMFNYDGTIIHIDPVAEYADYSQLPKADIILITHEHGDHLSQKAIEEIRQEGTLIISNNSSYQIIQQGEVLANGDKKEITSQLSIEAVPAYNSTPERTNFHPKDRDNGYVLNIENLRIYVAGDTEEIEEMKELKEIDIAFFPVAEPYTMSVEQAIRSAKTISPSILYPYHYAKSPVEEIKSALKDQPQIEVRIRKM